MRYENSLYPSLFNLLDLVPANSRSESATSDIIEFADHYEVTVDLPGVSRENVSIDLNNGLLRIEARRHVERSEQVKYVMQERRKGSVVRTFRISSSVDQDGVSASLKDGVLTVAIPKKQSARRIAIN